jgi:small redox-active disulfide protein 2
MIHVKVLGPGCANCRRLEDRVRIAAGDRDDVAIEKVTDVSTMLGYGIMATPGLVIDETVVSTGRLPSDKEIASWLG